MCLSAEKNEKALQKVNKEYRNEKKKRKRPKKKKNDLYRGKVSKKAVPRMITKRIYHTPRGSPKKSVSGPLDKQLNLDQIGAKNKSV